MLTAKLVLERLNERGKLLERREQQSRSFTRGLIDLLYTMHSQVPVAGPYTIESTDMADRLVDVTLTGKLAGRGVSGHLRIGAPAGQGSVITEQAPTSSATAGQCGPAPRVSLLGNDLGIIVGIDNTAVTPDDRRLGQRIGHGRRPADGGAVMFENYADGEDTSYDIDSATKWVAQEFTPAVSHRITSVWVKIYKAGAPGDLTVSIRPCDSTTNTIDFFPHATSVLATGTIAEGDIPAASPGALTQCVFATPVDLYAGHRYYINLDCPGSVGANNVYWRYDAGGATYARAFDSYASSVFGRRYYSADSGVSWTVASNSVHMFQEWGQSIGEFEYGGCDLSNINFVDPDGEFTIRRYLENHCGGAITVNEVGIAAGGTWHFGAAGTNYNYADTFLIARDIVGGGIAVADGELLRVTYVPQITV